MKKVLYVFIVCSILIGVASVCYFNPEWFQKYAKIVYDQYEQHFGEKGAEYHSEEKLNRLSVESNDYYYQTLTENQKKIYASVAESIQKFESEVEIPGYEYSDEDTTNQDVELAVYRFLLDHPEVFYISDKYYISTTSNLFTTKVKITFTYLIASQEELEEKITQIEEKIDSILAKIDLTSDDFSKELAIHDLVGKNVKYYDYENIEDIPASCHTIYGTLMENSAVCDGFAKTMKLLLNRCQIDSIVVTGALKEESHAWNLVKLGEQWYNLDLTSNKSIYYNNRSYVIHAYFNITDEQILKTHRFDDKELLPVSESMEQNYFTRKEKRIEENDSFDTKFGTILKGNENEELLEFATNMKDVPSKIASALSYKYYNSEYVDPNSSKFSYYNVLNTYVLLRIR